MNWDIIARNADRTVQKFTSGQFILTIVCAYVFAWCALHEVLSKETIGTILGIVFASYFQRKRVEDKPSA